MAIFVFGKIQPTAKSTTKGQMKKGSVLGGLEENCYLCSCKQPLM